MSIDLLTSLSNEIYLQELGRLALKQKIFTKTSQIEALEISNLIIKGDNKDYIANLTYQANDTKIKILQSEIERINIIELRKNYIETDRLKRDYDIAKLGYSMEIAIQNTGG